MKADELPMRGLDDARLAIHAASGFPAWLWSVDGARILWANPVGAKQFGADCASSLNIKTFGPADTHRRQIAQLAARLRMDGPPRLERLRGFGAPLGRLATCSCTKLTLADGREAILIAAAEALGRTMPLTERLQRLVQDADIPLAAFGRDGAFVGASDAARALLGFRDLSEAGLDDARNAALATGRTETSIGMGHLVLQRVGSGADVGLIALLKPDAVASPATIDEASTAPFALFDEMSDFDEDGSPQPVREPAIETATTDATHDDFAEEDELPVAADDAPDETIPPRTQPLRFLWEIDARERFAISSDDLLNLVGTQAAATLEGPWHDVASAYAPYGRMAAAIASRAAWSGISLALPADAADEPLMADLSGIPTYSDGEFTGYRGFGVVTDLEALTRLETLRRRDCDRGPAPQSLSAHTPSPPFAMDSDDAPEQKADQLDTVAHESLANVDTPANVVHFRSSPDGHPPVLTPIENNAFNELARELSARLEAEHAAPIEPAQPSRDAIHALSEAQPLPEPPVSGARMLLDASPAPIAVHRDGHILYANPAFLAAYGHADLTTLQSGYFDPDTFAHAKHLALEWDGEAAQGLIANTPQSASAVAASEPGAATAEDLGAILDAADEAVVMFDADGLISACNRSAARLFGVHGDTLAGHDLASLFTADTQVAISPLRERLATSMSEQAVEARTVVGGVELPLRLTIGRARPDGPNFYAIVRDLSPQKAGEAELVQARRQTERASADKADILARISHEMRAPLGAIIGFADVMIEQRFGPLGNDRYADYLRDIRGCGERVVAIVDDLLDLSRIESGKRDLAPTPQDLNTLVEQCVLAMQPEANRERIIIRSSLAHPLPHIVADGAALRQITLNLIGNSIHLANPGGQVIVSTAYADSGDVLLRVRDTGHGLNDNEVATALAPFRPASEDGDAPALIRLSLTRALAEASHARFTVKPAPYAGTLIEVAFPLGQVNR